MSKPLIAILGPTSSGKTKFSIFLAQQINGEIISADSIQVYKYMNIGTSKPPGKWLTVKGKRFFMVNGVPHYMIDVIKPEQKFSVGKYTIAATKIIEEIYKKGKIPILAGGTGLYIKAIIKGLCPAPSANQKIRRNLKKEATQNGIEYLYNRLKKIDPCASLQIHCNNLQRIIRALEVYQITGIPFSQIQQNTPIPNYKTIMIGLKWNREMLYKRINQRVEKMFKDGLVKEVQSLLDRGYNRNLPSMQGLGYKQVFDYLEKKIDLEETISLVKRDTRRYAKRQLTWFNKDKDIHWIEIDKDIDIKEGMNKMCLLVKKILTRKIIM